METGPRRSLAIYLPSLASGGAERMHIGLASAFISRGWDVIFLLQRAEGAFLNKVPKGARVVSLDRTRTLACLLPMIRFLRNERPSILLSNLGHNNVMAVWAAALARVRTRVIMSQHTMLSLECAEHHSWQYRLLPLLYRLFIPYAHGIVCVSQGVARDLSEMTGIGSESLTVIYNPVVFHDFNARMEAPLTHPWLAEKRGPVILAVGRLQEEKDFKTLISAFALVAKKRDARLIILGEGPQRAQLVEHANSLGMGKRIDMPGFVENPLSYMRAADLFAMSSRYEGFGNALAEALACGTPVVSTDCPHGPSEILKGGQFGSLVPVGDARALANAMLQTLDHPLPRGMLKERGHEFTAARAADLYLKLFNGTSGLDVVMVGPYPEDISLIKGGVQASVIGLSRALLTQPEVARVIGISIPLVANRSKLIQTVSPEGIKITYLNAPYKFLSSSTVYLPRVLHQIRKLRHPIVHVHGTGLFQTALCSLLRWRSVPFVWTLHGITEKETLSRYREHPTPGNAARHFFYKRLERATLSMSPHIFVDTPYVREEIKTPGTVHVLAIGIFTAEFAALPDNPRTAPVVLSLGVIDPRKGHHLTLESFAAVKKNVADARLIIAGSLTVPAYYDLLQAHTKELGLTDSVEFLIDRPRSEIIAALGRARVLALHSQEESQGIALCEALAAGVPVVATRVGGIPYVVTDKEDGFLVDYGNISGFADAIKRLLSDNPLHERMAQKAPQFARRFDWKNIAGEVVKVYQSAQEGRSPVKQ